MTSWRSRPSTGRSREGADGLVAGCHREGASGSRAFSLSWDQLVKRLDEDTPSPLFLSLHGVNSFGRLRDSGSPLSSSSSKCKG